MVNQRLRRFTTMRVFCCRAAASGLSYAQANSATGAIEAGVAQQDKTGGPL